ncbi:radical SAM protein [Desulfothermus sp.]
MANSFKIPHLISGGVITNYFCTSKCLHCLYRCSPFLDKNYIHPDDLKYFLKIIASKGRATLHIGGGEPFLNFEALKEVVYTISNSTLCLEYVETNSSWFKSKDKAKDWLSQLKHVGLGSILVSISPFHIEHIPFYKVLGVIEAAREVGVHVFPWIESFIPDILKLDINKTHKLDEFIKILGKGYLKEVVERYWIHPGGRAIKFLKRIYKGKSIKEVFLEPNCQQQLLNTSHFHVDLYGNYIPGLCSGICIKIEDITDKISDTKYPLLNLLYHKGVKGLFEFAKKEYGFIETSDYYINKCHLCLEIRDFLIKNKKVTFYELGPIDFYS